MLNGELFFTETLPINVYEAGKRLSIIQHPVDWIEIFMKQSVGKCKQINFWNLFVKLVYITRPVDLLR